VGEGLTKPLRAIAEIGRRPSALLAVTVTALSLVTAVAVIWILVVSARALESSNTTTEALVRIIEKQSVQLARMREQSKADPF
jgi:hypothetical protein